MSEKVVLILVDGMRPDAMLSCTHPFVSELIAASAHALDACTVMPSVTLPCHMSLFHSVDPERHGILTNTYVPQVRPIDGLFDQLNGYGKTCAFYYTWEQLRDISRPGHLRTSVLLNMSCGQVDTDRRITDLAIDGIKNEPHDFTFIYLGETDEVGHDHGWMSSEYMAAVSNAMEQIRRIREALTEDYTLIVTADHGGHGRCHGTEEPEDMTIPICFLGSRFAPDTAVEGVSIKDIAPTVVKLLDVPPVKEWEGTPRC